MAHIHRFRYYGVFSILLLLLQKSSPENATNETTTMNVSTPVPTSSQNATNETQAKNATNETQASELVVLPEAPGTLIAHNVTNENETILELDLPVPDPRYRNFGQQLVEHNFLRRYGIPHIGNVDLKCSPASHSDGTLCKDGLRPKKVTDTDDIKKKLDPWYHPGNAKRLKLIKTTGKACSIACSSGKCFYDLTHYFDYICGTKGLKSTDAEISSIKNKHAEYLKVDDARICWDGSVSHPNPHLGKEYDRTLITKEDTAMSFWYEKSVPKANLRELERQLSKHCKNNNCIFSPKKFTFICGKGTPRIAPPVFVFPLLIVLFGLQ